jgi:hypothetical protein
VDATYANAAQVFVEFRALHSVVHCTFDLVMFSTSTSSAR